MLLPERVARGLVVGKFCPLHLGHEHLIEFAATRCTQLLVIGWSQPGFPGYSAERRERWLRARFPQATVAVSPGGATAFARIAQSCPTFSWGLVEGAARYEIIVYVTLKAIRKALESSTSN